MISGGEWYLCKVGNSAYTTVVILAVYTVYFKTMLWVDLRVPAWG